MCFAKRDFNKMAVIHKRAKLRINTKTVNSPQSMSKISVTITEKAVDAKGLLIFSI